MQFESRIKNQQGKCETQEVSHTFVAILVVLFHLLIATFTLVFFQTSSVILTVRLSNLDFPFDDTARTSDYELQKPLKQTKTYAYE